jgi:hypothetical protein
MRGDQAASHRSIAMPRKQKEPLVSRPELEKVVDGIKDLEPYREFLKGRWIGMVMWWDSRSADARWKYFLLRALGRVCQLCFGLYIS